MARYLINGQSVRIPGLDSGLIDVHNSHCDFRAHLGDDAACWASYVTRTNATDPLYLKHLGRTQHRAIKLSSEHTSLQIKR